MSASVRPEPATAFADHTLDESHARELELLAAVSGAPPPEQIGGRYRVIKTLGRGGMAGVHLVEDGSTGRMLALKRLVTDPSHRHYSEMAALFEREFHTLVQLSHPRIVEVYDFGVDQG